MNTRMWTNAAGLVGLAVFLMACGGTQRTSSFGLPSNGAPANAVPAEHVVAMLAQGLTPAELYEASSNAENHERTAIRATLAVVHPETPEGCASSAWLYNSVDEDDLRDQRVQECLTAHPDAAVVFQRWWQYAGPEDIDYVLTSLDAHPDWMGSGFTIWVTRLEPEDRGRVATWALERWGETSETLAAHAYYLEAIGDIAGADAAAERSLLESGSRPDVNSWYQLFWRIARRADSEQARVREIERLIDAAASRLDRDVFAALLNDAAYFLADRVGDEEAAARAYVLAWRTDPNPDTAAAIWDLHRGMHEVWLIQDERDEVVDAAVEQFADRAPIATRMAREAFYRDGDLEATRRWLDAALYAAVTDAERIDVLEARAEYLGVFGPEPDREYELMRHAQERYGAPYDPTANAFANRLRMRDLEGAEDVLRSRAELLESLNQSFFSLRRWILAVATGTGDGLYTEPRLRPAGVPTFVDGRVYATIGGESYAEFTSDGEFVRTFTGADGRPVPVAGGLTFASWTGISSDPSLSGWGVYDVDGQLVDYGVMPWRHVVHPDGQRIFFASAHSIGVFDRRTRTYRFAPNAGERVRELELSADGRLALVATNFDGFVTVWDTETLTPLRTIEGPTYVHSATSAPDSSAFYLTDNSGLLWTIDTTTWNATTDRLGRISHVTSHPTRPWLLLHGFFSNRVEVFDVEQGRVIVSTPDASARSTARWIDDKRFAMAVPGGYAIYDVEGDFEEERVIGQDWTGSQLRISGNHGLVFATDHLQTVDLRTGAIEHVWRGDQFGPTIAPPSTPGVFWTYTRDGQRVYRIDANRGEMALTPFAPAPGTGFTDIAFGDAFVVAGMVEGHVPGQPDRTPRAWLRVFFPDGRFLTDVPIPLAESDYTGITWNAHVEVALSPDASTVAWSTIYDERGNGGRVRGTWFHLLDTDALLARDVDAATQAQRVTAGGGIRDIRAQDGGFLVRTDRIAYYDYASGERLERDDPTVEYVVANACVERIDADGSWPDITRCFSGAIEGSQRLDDLGIFAVMDAQAGIHGLSLDSLEHVYRPDVSRTVEHGIDDAIAARIPHPLSTSLDWAFGTWELDADATVAEQGLPPEDAETTRVMMEAMEVSFTVSRDGTGMLAAGWTDDQQDFVWYPVELGERNASLVMHSLTDGEMESSQLELTILPDGSLYLTEGDGDPLVWRRRP